MMCVDLSIATHNGDFKQRRLEPDSQGGCLFQNISLPKQASMQLLYSNENMLCERNKKRTKVKKPLHQRTVMFA